MGALDPHVRLLVAAVVYTVAYLCAVALFGWMARRRGLATRQILTLMVVALVGGLAGAGLTQMLLTGTPGKSLLGGFAVGYCGVVIVKRQLGITRLTGDLFAVALAGGEAIGRIGCFFAGCCGGKPAGVAWAVYDDGAWRHPTQLYLALAAAFTFAVLVALERRGGLPENALFALQGMLLCATRFAIEFYRDVPTTALDLTTAQIACIAGFAFFAAMAVRIARRAAPRSTLVPART